MFYFLSVSLERSLAVDFVLYFVQAGIITVGDDTVALLFEFIQIVYDFASEKCRTIFESWFINDHGCSFRLNSLHDTLDRGLTEVIRIGFHSQTVNTDGNRLFHGGIESISLIIGVITGFLEDTVSDEVFTGTITFDNSAHHILWNIIDNWREAASYPSADNNRRNQRKGYCSEYRYVGQGRHPG